MPLQAVALKKNRCGTSPVSKISDNEHAAAALWNSEVLSVQNSVGEPIPEFAQRPEDGTKVPSAVRGQDTRDVFPDDPARPFAVSKSHELKGQVATVVVQSASEASNAEGLAGGASNEKVDLAILVPFDGGEVAVQRHAGIVVFEHGARERLDLGEGGGRPAERMPCKGCGFDAGADRDVSHLAFHTKRAP